MFKDASITRRDFISLVGASIVPLAIASSIPRKANASSWNARTIILAGRSVTCSANINAASSLVTANAQTVLVGAGAVGNLGAYVVMYNDGGAAVASRIAYSNGATSQVTSLVSATPVSGRSYRSLAVSYVFNSATGSYEDNFSNPVWSPFETAYSLDEVVYQTNSSGLTYGPVTGLMTYGYLPDLILAEGVGGNIGYIKKEDFIPNPPSSLDDVALICSSPQINRATVFDFEGTTPLDVYEVYYG